MIGITTPLGETGLLVAGFSGYEAISRLFSFNLDCVTQQQEQPIDAKKLIGQNVTLSIQMADDAPRCFNGIASRFTASGVTNGFTRYQLEFVPWTWILTRYADCKIFHNKKVDEILEAVFKARGFTDYKISLTGSYSPMEYCVQYRETDFNFISRLMEQNGIFYFFQHEQGKHTMVIADAASIHEKCAGQDTASYNPVSGGMEAEDCVTDWNMEQHLLSGKYSLTDYNFTTPSTSLLVNEPTIQEIGGNGTFEIFDFPGDFQVRSDGTAFAKVRMEEIETNQAMARGGGTVRSFTSGYKFSLADHFVDEQNASYILTEVRHIASVGGTYGLGGKDHYSNTFTCIPDSVPFRPQRITPKPFVQGPQTAVVVGKSQMQSTDGVEDDGNDTEDIWVDKYGRVVVRFFWDRAGSCSCRVRVSQDWAGKGWGAITIPRIGQEVIVSFLEGDPDRPIITGRVYNADQEVPYKLPDYQTRSSFMTRSSPNGSASTYNELRFEDKNGAEQVFVRAQYDQDNYVTHDSREWIGNNRSLVVTKDQMESVAGDRHEQVTGKHIEKIGGDSNSDITGNLNQKVGQNLSIQAGQNLYEKSGMNFAHEAGQAIHLKAGMSVVIEAGMELTLKAGSSFIDIGPAGIAISGSPLVMINSGGAAGSGSGSSPTSPASPTDPDLADDGKSGTKRGGGNAQNTGKDSTPLPVSTPTVGKAPADGGPAAPPPTGSESNAGALGGAAATAAAAVSQAQQAAQQGIQQASQAVNQLSQAANQAINQAQQAAQQAIQQAAAAAQQAASQAQQAAAQAQQAAQQTEQQAQQAVNQVTQEARQTYNLANQAAQQAQQAASQAVGQAKAQAEQAAAQAQQQAQQAAQQAAQAVQQVRQQAAQVEQQAQQAAQQAQQQAQQAEQAAQQAEKQAQQQAQQAAQQATQQGQQAAQQATQQAQQAAQQAQQQAQQAAAQAQQAAQQAQQQAQQAGQQVKQAAAGAQQAAQQAAQAAQQSAAQAMKALPKGL